MTCDTSTIFSVAAGCFRNAMENAQMKFSILNVVFSFVVLFLFYGFSFAAKTVQGWVLLVVLAFHLLASGLLCWAVKKKNITACKKWLIFEAVWLVALFFGFLTIIFQYRLMDPVFLVLAITLFVFKFGGWRLVYLFTQTTSSNMDESNQKRQNTDASETGDTKV